MGIAAILVMWPGPHMQTFVSPSHGGSTWNLTSIGPVVPEKMFENVNTWHTHRQQPCHMTSSPMSLRLRWANNLFIFKNYLHIRQPHHEKIYLQGMCRKRTPRSDCASVQCDQDLYCLLPESLGTIECIHGEQPPWHFSIFPSRAKQKYTFRVCAESECPDHCASVQCDQDLYCLLPESLDTIECIHGEQLPWHFSIFPSRAKQKYTFRVCAESERPDQTVHLCSVIRTFTVCCQNHWKL